MNRIFVIVSLTFISFKGINACFHHVNKTELTAIEVSLTNPLTGNDLYRVYYWNDLILYQSHYRFDSFEVVQQTANQIQTEKKLVSSELRNQFFIYHKDSVFGYSFDPIVLKNDGQKFSVDQRLKLITLQSGSLETALVMQPDSSVWNRDKTELKEVYKFKQEPDRPSFVRNLYFSKKMNKIPESFSRRLDSARHLKLYKVEGVSDEFYSERDKVKWPGYRVVSEMKEINISDPQQIMLYFDRYRRMCGL